MANNAIRYFTTEFFPEVRAFFQTIDKKAVDKIFWNIDIAERTNDPRLFKKLTGDIWEFRTNMATFNTGYWLFGTKPVTIIPW